MFNLIDFSNKLGKTTEVPTYVAVLIIVQIVVIIALVIFILIDTINAKKEKEATEKAIIVEDNNKKDAIDVEQYEEINNAEIYKKPDPVVEKRETPIANNNDLILNRLINDIGTKSGVAATSSMMDQSSNYIFKQTDSYSIKEDDDTTDDFEDSQEDLEDEKEILSTEIDNNKNVRINKIVIYRKNFIAKMCQAEDDVKELYQELINKLSSYSKIKGKIGNHYDTYKIGGNTIVKLAIRNKILTAYFALSPDELVDVNFHFDDVSKIKRYQATPVSLKVKSYRSLKNTFELIEKVIQPYDLTQISYQMSSNVKEDFPYRSTNYLIASGSIVVSSYDEICDLEGNRISLIKK